MVNREIPQLGAAESRLEDLGIELPAAPTPFGSYVEATQAGNLLFLSGMLPVRDHRPAYVGVLGSGFEAQVGRDAARVAALGALASAKDYLGTLNRIKRIIRLGVFMATSRGFVDHPGVADGASDLFRDVFGAENMAVRSVVGVASLPLGVPVELEIILELKE